MRSWWKNCALEADPEIMAIDKMEDMLSPINPDVLKIRELISTLELCHHKAENWIRNIIKAIGEGKTSKGLGTRLPGQLHPVEKIWQNACAALTAWCAGHPAKKINLTINTIAASKLLACIGERSPLKEWQIQRVIEKIRSSIHWPQSCADPTARYELILLENGEYECIYHNECPDYYKEHENFWQITVRTIIHDTDNGNKAELSLGIAIDLLMPCHWRFVENLQIVLEAIGGKLYQKKPFAACGRNINLIPIRQELEIISSTLKIFCGEIELKQKTDKNLLNLLGEPTEIKRWLSASLDKTIRLQLNPPAELQAISSLSGPDWL